MEPDHELNTSYRLPGQEPTGALPSVILTDTAYKYLQVGSLIQKIKRYNRIHVTRQNHPVHFPASHLHQQPENVTQKQRPFPLPRWKP